MSKITQKQMLFNPHYEFIGNPETILQEYPPRSQALELYAKQGIDPKKLDSKFIKDDYMYLLRGAEKGQESGFYSQAYANKQTIENQNLDPNKVAFAQTLNGNTPFISTTTNLYVAASFSRKQRIYIVRIPIQDVYTFSNDDFLLEFEYMIPDYISSEEIAKSFRYDKFKQIYGFLTNDAGLALSPEDLGITNEDLISPDKDRIAFEMQFNNDGAYFDELLEPFQTELLNSTLKSTPKKLIKTKK